MTSRASIKLLILAALSLLAASCTQTEAAPADEATATATSAVAFLSADDLHEIDVEFDEADYENLLAAYAADGSKEWISATVTIDGATYEDAGVRLKGNSSLFGLTGGNRQGPSGNADAERPEELPWLIRLDKYVDGQNHEGIYDIVVRSNNSATALNEAVALDLLELAGLASQDSAYTSFSVNGSDPVLRLVMEHPDEVWMANAFTEDGSLYKAESTGDYSYRGDDPDAYDEVFDLEAGNDDDLSELTSFLDFINNSDDESFYAELDQRLDTEAFATYLAMQELIANQDDIDGRGNNSYLFYDESTGLFTVVPWDHNLAFGGVGVGLAGGEIPNPQEGLPADRPDRPAGNRQLPAGPGGEGLQTSNVLVDRFLADPEYAALYEQELSDLTATLFDSGVATQLLADWVNLLTSDANRLVDVSTITSEATAIESFFG